MTFDLGRQIVEKCKEWQGVPYAFGERSKKGCDCLNLFAAACSSLGVNKKEIPKTFPGFGDSEEIQHHKGLDPLCVGVALFLDIYLNEEKFKWFREENMLGPGTRVGDLILVKSKSNLRNADHGVIVINSDNRRPRVLHYLDRKKDGKAQLTEGWFSYKWTPVMQIRIAACV